MKLFPGSDLAENIINELRKGPLKTSVLINLLSTNPSSKVTVQGVYKSLRSLREQGIILLHNKEAMLNQTWVQQLENFALLAEHSYRNPVPNSGHFLQMRDGDKINYEFKNPVKVDVFWNHVLYVLFDAFPSTDRWFAYSSHCWFLLARRKEELALRDHMISKGVKYLFTAGHNNPLDRMISKDFDGVNSQYYMRTEGLSKNFKNSAGLVLNVFGDYIIEAHYDRNVTNKIEEFYSKNSSINPEKLKELEDIVSSPSKIKFSITKNSKKAAKLQRLFEPHFYLKKS